MARFVIRLEPEKVVVVTRRDRKMYVVASVWAVLLCSDFLADNGRWTAHFVKIWIAEFVALMVFTGLWALGSREVMEFTPDLLTCRAGWFGFSRKKIYQMRAIQSPRYVASKPGILGTPSGLGFIYDGMEVRVGDAIKQSEAQQIVIAVLQQIPKLKFVWGKYAAGEPELEQDIPPDDSMSFF